MTKRLLLIVSTVVAITSSVAAQSTGSFTGLVTDSQGGSLPNVTVLIENMATNFRITATTNETGNYFAPNLLVGPYRLRATATGFATSIQENIQLQVDQKATINFSLKPAAVNQTVVVSAPESILETTTSTLAQIEDTRRINDLPLNGRDVMSLLGLQAGVSTSGGNLNYANTYLYPTNGWYYVPNSINGARGNQTGYKLDGGTNTNGSMGIPDPFPNPDAVQEFSVQTNNFSAENGGALGGFVNVVTKSGTNQYHGALFEFYRSSAFNARNHFAAKVDPLKRHQFGGAIGGPGRIPYLYDGRNKTFFFFSYQGTRSRHANAAAIFTTLSAAQQTGNLSGTTAAKDPTTGQPFPDNVIPQSRFDPSIVKLLAYMPPSTQGNKLSLTTPPQILNDNQEILRLDHMFSGGQQLTGRWMHVSFANPQTYLSGVLYGAAAGFTSVTDNVLVSYTRAIRSNLANVVRFTYLNLNLISTPAVDLAVADLGANVPATRPGNISVSISGYSGLSNGFNNISYDRNFESGDDVHYYRGRNAFAFGGKLLTNIKESGGYYTSDGSYTFSGQITGNVLADFLLGLPATFVMRQAFTQHITSTKPSLYFQDDLRLAQYFTLNLGLRWDPDVPYVDSINMWPAYRPGVQSQRFINAPVGLVFADDAGVPRGVTTTAWDNFAPRIGFAWNPKGQSTVIRGAYGIFVDQTQAQDAWRSAEPYVANISIPAPPSFKNPYGSGTPVNPQQNLHPDPNHVFTKNLAFGSLEPHFKSGVVQSTNMTIERRLAKTMVVRGSYVGNFGTRLLDSEAINPAVYVPGSSTVANTNNRRLNPVFGNIYEIRHGAHSWYNSGQLSLRREYNKALTFTANYTFSKSIDTSSAGEGVSTSIPGPNPFNLAANRGLSDFDSAHKFNASVLWNVPFGSDLTGVARFIATGWEINGIAYASSGTPFSITSAQDLGFAGVGAGVRADLVGDPNLPGDRSEQDKILHYFNSLAFALPAAGTFGDSGRNILRGPGYFDIDSTAMKTFSFHERVNIQFRADAFNLVNHTNLGMPNSSLDSPLIGQITSAGDPRILQFALRVGF